MFNITRTYPAPQCLQCKSYNEEEVINALRDMCFDKCYLCERDNVQDVEIEHITPHKGDKNLKYDWENLFYSCARCNSIKGSTHIKILDCAKEQTPIWKLIKCLMPSAPDEDIQVSVYDTARESELENTITLLSECYNSTNTARRGISREVLREQILSHFIELLNFRQRLLKKTTGPTKEQEIKESILAMTSPKYPFSIFWIHHCKNDSLLLKKCPELAQKFSD